MNFAVFITEVINDLLNPSFCKIKFLDVDDSFEPHTMFRRLFHDGSEKHKSCLQQRCISENAI